MYIHFLLLVLLFFLNSTYAIRVCWNTFLYIFSLNVHIVHIFAQKSYFVFTPGLLTIKNRNVYSKVFPIFSIQVLKLY